MERNYNTISPSAKALLLMKGLTDIPYARQAAELISRPAAYVPDYSSADTAFWARVTHFEARYQSIDQLLEDLPVTNILELSSGFSFRGLAAAQQQAGIHYIDTDLPEVVAQKQAFLTDLQSGSPEHKGHYEIRALNALDRDAFHAVINSFPEGPFAIINEGLLMYLGIEEKKAVCATIHDALQQRGGWWITADVYIRNAAADRSMDFKDELQEFFNRHNIEANKFADFDAATAFFRDAGFTIDREAETAFEKITTLPYFLKTVPPEMLEGLKDVGRIQSTWRLKVA